MLTGTVISSDLSARGNVVFHAGDEVTEHNFGEDRFRKLVSEGLIKCEQVEVPEELQPNRLAAERVEPLLDQTANDGIANLLEDSVFGSKKKKK